MFFASKIYLDELIHHIREIRAPRSEFKNIMLLPKLSSLSNIKKIEMIVELAKK